MSTTARSAPAQRVTARLVAGAAAGLVGGIVFGMLMAMMGMLPTVAMLVGSSSAAVGAGVFWAWFALRHEPSRCLCAAALLAWVGPVIAVTATSVAAGRMVDAPRPVLLRPAAVLQTTLALRAARRGCGRLRSYQCRSSHS